MKIQNIILFSILICTTAQAANERGNGGDVVVNDQGEVRFLDAVRRPDSVLLNLEDPKLAPALENELRSMPNLSPMTFFTESRTYPLVSHLMKTLRALKFYLVKGPLPEINDRGIVTLAWGKGKNRIERFAHQYITRRAVLVDRDYYKALPPEDLPLFLAHEGWIRLYHDDLENPPLASTDKISGLVNQMFASSDLPASHLVQYLCDIGVLTSAQSFPGYTKISGILTPLKYPTDLVVTYKDRDRESCYSFELTRSGPAEGKFIPRNRYDDRSGGRYHWDFVLKGTTYKAQILLNHNLETYRASFDFFTETELGGVSLSRDIFESKLRLWTPPTN